MSSIREPSNCLGQASIKSEGEVRTALNRLSDIINKLSVVSEYLAPLINHGKPMAGGLAGTDKNLCEIAAIIDSEADRIENVVSLISSVEI